jgi:hypothetical protein
MASYNGGHVAYVASSASVGADLVVLSAAGFAVKVTNISGSAPLFWTVSHQGGSCPVPTTNGTTSTGGECYVTAAAAGSSTNARAALQFGAIVQVVSTGSPSYMVEIQGVHSTS